MKEIQLNIIHFHESIQNERKVNTNSMPIRRFWNLKINNPSNMEYLTGYRVCVVNWTSRYINSRERYQFGQENITQTLILE